MVDTGATSGPHSTLGNAILAAYNSFKTNTQALNSSSKTIPINNSTQTRQLGVTTATKPTVSNIPQSISELLARNVNRPLFDNILTASNTSLVSKYNQLIKTQDGIIIGSGFITPTAAKPATTPANNISTVISPPADLSTDKGTSNIPPGSSFVDSLRAGFKDIQNTIGPLGLVIGIGLIGLVILKK